MGELIIDYIGWSNEGLCNRLEELKAIFELPNSKHRDMREIITCAIYRIQTMATIIDQLEKDIETFKRYFPEFRDAVNRINELEQAAIELPAEILDKNLDKTVGLIANEEKCT